MFEALESKQTGLNFSNRLTPTNQFNVFHYMYYYNGAGVGAAILITMVWLIFFSLQTRATISFLNEGKTSFQRRYRRCKNSRRWWMEYWCFGG